MNTPATIAALSFLFVIAAASIACAWFLWRADRRSRSRLFVQTFNEVTEDDVKKALRSADLSSWRASR